MERPVLSSSSSSWIEQSMRQILDLRAQKGSLRVYKEEEEEEEEEEATTSSTATAADPEGPPSQHGVVVVKSLQLDFSSNDYLGLARSEPQQQLVEKRYQELLQQLQDHNHNHHHQEQQQILQQLPPVLGSTGSRLLSGDSHYARKLETRLAKWHNRPAALLFNSGYDANLSVLSCLPCDYFVYDEYSHNSLRMGMRLSKASSRSSSSSSSSSRRRRRQPTSRSNNSNNIKDDDIDDGHADDNGSTLYNNKLQEEKNHVSFAHNNVEDLRTKLFHIQEQRRNNNNSSSSSSSSNEDDSMEERTTETTIKPPRTLIVVESVYSMDGDVAPLKSILDLASEFDALVLVDEAHGLGIFGDDRDDDDDDDNTTPTTSSRTTSSSSSSSSSSRGVGVLAQQQLEDHPSLVCSIHTFGKAAGCHGAVACGSKTFRQYLWNYGWPLIYSTSLPLHSLVAIECSYETMTSTVGKNLRRHNQRLVSLFRLLVKERILNNQQEQEQEQQQEQHQHRHHQQGLGLYLLPSQSPIQALVLPRNGNQACTEFCERVWIHSNRSIRLYPIKSPTVPIGMERIRIILHGHNQADEVHILVECMFRSLVDMNLVVNNNNNCYYYYKGGRDGSVVRKVGRQWQSRL